LRTFILTICLFLAACQQETVVSVTEQTQRVERARKNLQVERTRLTELQDSLAVRIAENIDLGMSPDAAESTERARIQIQKTVVDASQSNLTHQEELLALMKSGGR